jgi:hypothetical protein
MRERTMYRLIPAGCVLALRLTDNKLNRDIPRHKELLKRHRANKRRARRNLPGRFHHGTMIWRGTWEASR